MMSSISITCVGDLYYTIKKTNKTTQTKLMEKLIQEHLSFNLNFQVYSLLLSLVNPNFPLHITSRTGNSN